MAKPKSVTIQLTPKQREKLRSLTGVDHAEVKFEATKATLGGKTLAVKSAPATKFGTKDGVPAGDIPIA